MLSSSASAETYASPGYVTRNTGLEWAGYLGRSFERSMVKSVFHVLRI